MRLGPAQSQIRWGGVRDLRDIASETSLEEHLRMPTAPSALLPPPDDRERLYRELWPVVRAMLRTRYAGLPDQEEVYQEAWTELLEYEASGNEVRDTRSLLKTIAERRARDRVRNYRPAVLEPADAAFVETADAAFVETADSAPLPDEQAQIRLGAAQIRHVIETLDEREAEALKLRYDLLLDASEISRQMQVTRGTWRR